MSKGVDKARGLRDLPGEGAKSLRESEGSSCLRNFITIFRADMRSMLEYAEFVVRGKGRKMKLASGGLRAMGTLRVKKKPPQGGRRPL